MVIGGYTPSLQRAAILSIAILPLMMAAGVHAQQSSGKTECPGDTNGDLLVNVADLVNVILFWGTDGIGDGVDADTDDDGTVGVGDLINVTLNWGSCLQLQDGSCCLPVGVCIVTSPIQCVDFFQGDFQGEGTQCEDPNPCLGACCISGAGETQCLLRTEIGCLSLNGTFLGAGTECEDGACDL